MAGAYQIISADENESVIEITLPERNGMQETLRFKIDGRVDSETIIRAINKLRDNKVDALASKRGAVSLSRYLQHSLLMQSDQLRGSASLRTYYRDTMIKVITRLTDSKVKPLIDNSFMHVCSLANLEKFYDLTAVNVHACNYDLLDVYIVPNAASDMFVTLVAKPANQEHINSRSYGCVMNVLKSVFTKEQLKVLGVQ